MSDAVTSQVALDPDRPWIIDEEDLPSQMNWLDTLFNPSGHTSRLHFTRAWTLLFMTQVFAWFGFGVLITTMIGATGADMEWLNAFELYFVAAVFVITTFLSYIIHTRRMNHAGRSPLWAALVLIPLLVALAQFTGTVVQKSGEYQELYDARAEFLEDPAAWRNKKLDEQRTAQVEAAESRRERAEENDVPEMCKREGGASGSGRPGGRGDWGNQGPDVESPMPNKEAFILRPAASGIVQPIMFMSLPIMIWTLLWVARAPLQGAQYPKRGIVNILTTPSGRISRLQYLAGLAAILGLVGLVMVVQSILSATIPAVAALAFLALLPVIWCAIAITFKRLHDLGRPGLFMLWPWIVSAGVGVLAAGMVFLNFDAFNYAQTCGGDMPLAVLFMFIVLGITFVCGHLGMLFLLSTTEPEMRENKYGPAPTPGISGPQFTDAVAPTGHEGGTFTG